MRTQKLLLAACLVCVGFLLADEQPAAKDSEPHKIQGLVVMEPGKPLPNRVSFVDRRAAKEHRQSAPVSVQVDKDGHFEVKLDKLPTGYLVTTFPCSKPRKILLKGEDLLAKQSTEAAQVGNASTFAAGVSRFADIASRLLGGIQFADCGGQ